MDKAEVTRLPDGSLRIKPPPATLSLSAMLAQQGADGVRALIEALRAAGIRVVVEPGADPDGILDAADSPPEDTPHG